MDDLPRPRDLALVSRNSALYASNAGQRIVVFFHWAAVDHAKCLVVQLTTPHVLVMLLGKSLEHLITGQLGPVAGNSLPHLF
jgi:hypothetical protein